MNGWTCEFEKLVKKKGEQAMASQWLHSKSYKRYKMMDSVLGGSMTILSFTGGFLESEDLTTSSIKYISFIVGFLAMIQQLMSFSGKSAVHKATMSEYADIVNTITSELAKKPDDREEVRVFMNDIRQRVFLSSKNAPNIPNKVMRSFYSHFSDVTPANPIDIDHMNELTIPVQYLRKGKGSKRKKKKELPKTHRNLAAYKTSKRPSIPHIININWDPNGDDDGGGGGVRVNNVLRKSITDSINAKSYSIRPPIEFQLKQLDQESIQ
jgi:hypothetical protein